MPDNYYRKGFGLKGEVESNLTADYHSQIVNLIRSGGNRLAVGDVTFQLANEFGFCYGVDRAVEYAYQTRAKFPERRVFLVGEIIHNPHVNRRMEEKGINILRPQESSRFDFSDVKSDDVVIIPAFGVTVADFKQLREMDCVLVDTTCGSVLNVWKRVQQYARDGFTALVHGKYFHEETKATASQVLKYEGGKYIIIRDMDEAQPLLRFIEEGGDPAPIVERFAQATSTGFDPELDLVRIGVANQTTMLANESLAIANLFKKSLERRYGPENIDQHFRSFDTICSATQERQDAVLEMMEDPPDVMIVIGGYNSSNTNHLAKICSEHTATYHIEDASCIDPETGSIEFKPVGEPDEISQKDWLGDARTVGVTAGASTPNNKIGQTIERIVRLKGLELPLESAPVF